MLCNSFKFKRFISTIIIYMIVVFFRNHTVYKIDKVYALK